MSKRLNKWLILLTLAAIVLGVTISCKFPSFFGNEKVTDISTSEGFYIIDPATILDTISQEKTDVFIPQLVTPEAVSLKYDIPVQWSQGDYLRIVDALSYFVWNETMEGWRLERMLFQLDCIDVISGPQNASIQFFKIDHTQEKESRLLRDIWINPSKKLVSWHEVEKYPNTWGTRTIDFSQINIPAEKALQIAEENGGSKARSVAGNSCILYLLLSPGGQYSGWNVRYSGSNSEDLFNIHINILTGEYDIVTSNTK